MHSVEATTLVIGFIFQREETSPRTVNSLQPPLSLIHISTVYLSMTPAENIKMTSAGDDAMDTGWFTIQKITTTTDGYERKSVLMLDEEEKDIHLRYEIYDTAHDNYVQTKSKLLLESSNAKLAADHIKAINMAIDVVRNRAASTGKMCIRDR